MRSITREALIDRLTELEPRSTVEPAVDQSIEALGWQDKAELTALEVIALGTVMAEQARVTLAASEDPSHRQAAAVRGRWRVARVAEGDYVSKPWDAIAPDGRGHPFETWRAAFDYADRMARADR